MKTSTRAVAERWKYRDLVATYGQGRPAGALATAAWLSARGLLVPARTEWELSIVLGLPGELEPPALADGADTRLHIAISSAEWGFYFCHHDRASWIRVTDVPFIHQRDDFALLFKVPPLRELGSLVRALEETYSVSFCRESAAIRSTIRGSAPAIREWVTTAI